MSATQAPERAAHLGEHILSICPDEGRRLDLIASIFRAGFEVGCRCLYLTGRTPPAGVLDGLRARRCEVDRPLARRQLVMLTAEQSYIPDGRFDPDRMLDLWVDLCTAARKDGFEGVCATGEPAWLTQGVPGVERWLEYEARLNRLEVDRERVGIVCQYSGLDLSPWFLDELEKLHPLVHRGDGVAPSASFVRDPDYVSEVPLAEELEPPADTLPCDCLCELISADIDGQLSPRRHDELARHLAACSACRSRAQSILDLRTMCRSLRTPEAIPGGLWAKVQRALAEAER